MEHAAAAAGIAIDWTISIGTIIAVLTLLTAVISAYFALQNKTTVLSNKLESVVLDVGKMEKSYERMTTILENLARQDEKMTSMERRQTSLSLRILRLEGGVTLNLPIDIEG